MPEWEGKRPNCRPSGGACVDSPTVPTHWSRRRNWTGWENPRGQVGIRPDIRLWPLLGAWLWLQSKVEALEASNVLDQGDPNSIIEDSR